MSLNVCPTLLKIYANCATSDSAEIMKEINSLPKNLKNKIHSNLQSETNGTFTEKICKALGDLSKEIFRGLDKKSKTKIETVFSRIFNLQNNPDYFESSAAVEQKLRALESVAIINQANEWAGGNKIKQKIAIKIVNFINNPISVELNLSA